MRRTVLLAGIATLVQVACAKQAETVVDSTKGGRLSEQTVMPDIAILDTATAMSTSEWELLTLGGAPAPRGGGGQPATLKFDTPTSRASGFAGCNRYSGPYTLKADSLSFGALASTKMFCQDGDSLERQFLAMLANVRTFGLTDSTLALFAPGMPLATFRRR